MKVKLFKAFLSHYSPAILSARKQTSVITIPQVGHSYILSKYTNFFAEYLPTKKIRKIQKKSRNKVLPRKLL